MQAREINKKVGVVSTARITHATPAPAYAHSVDRNYESSVPDDGTEQVDIADQVRETTNALPVTPLFPLFSIHEVIMPALSA